MKDSKNQEVWARCHLTGEASGHDCTIISSGVSGSQSDKVRRRMERKRSIRVVPGLDWGVDWAETDVVGFIAFAFRSAGATWLVLRFPGDRTPHSWKTCPFQTGMDRLRPF